MPMLVFVFILASSFLLSSFETNYFSLDFSVFNRMQLLVNGDPTTLSYWLEWRVFLCAIWVLAPMVVASFLIWKYEQSGNSESDKSWKPCLKEIHPIFLMCFRLIAFCLLLVALSFDLALHGAELFYYYTQWTFTLVTIYFGLGSLLSIHGCYHNLKTNSNNECYLKEDTEHGLHVPLAHGVNGNGARLSERLDGHGTLHALITSAVWYDLFQVLYQVYLMFCPVEDTAAKSCFSVLHGYNKMNSFLGFSFPMSYLYTSPPSPEFIIIAAIIYEATLLIKVTMFLLEQMTAGAVTLTDIVYWCVIFPFMALRDYEMSFLTVFTHSLNGILLLGDTAMNSLEFPWFRISYFIWWTGIYVVFQWIVHACVPIWWPYPFLELSAHLAPLWYLVVASMHVPCYAIYLTVVKVKHWLLSRWFPHSYRYSP